MCGSMSISNEDHRRKILVFPFDLMSHYLRCIVLTQKYTNYNVLFAHSEKYNDFVTEAGYSTFKTKGFNTSNAIKAAANFDFSWLNKKDIEEVFLAQVDAIKTLRPEFVIGDANPTLRMASEYCGVRYIALMNGYMSMHYQRTRKLPYSHPANSKLSKLSPKVRDTIIKFAEKMAMRSVHKPFKKLRAKYDLSYKRSYLEEMEGDENLICDQEKLFPQKEIKPNYKFVGPLLYRSKDRVTPKLKISGNRRNTICVSMGSTGSWEKLSFLSKSDFSNFNIITLGDTHKHITGDHVQALPFANFDSILPHCGFLICHGGNGTTYQAIEHGIFALCIPDHFEQEWNIQGLEELQYGIGIYEDIEQTVTAYLNS